MSNRIYRIKYSLYVLLCILGIAGCTKDDSNNLSRYEGVYQLDSMYWTGEIIDINGDGKGERDLLHEFSGYPGFVKEWISGKVELFDNSTLSFHSVVPICVRSEPKVQPDIKYYEIDIKAKWRNDWGSPDFDTETFEPLISDINKGVRRAVLHNINDSSYELHVDCSIFTQELSPIQGTIIFYFKK